MQKMKLMRIDYILFQLCMIDEYFSGDAIYYWFQSTILLIPFAPRINKEIIFDSGNRTDKNISDFSIHMLGCYTSDW